MKTIKRIFSILCLILIIINIFNINLYKVEALTLSDMQKETDEFMKKGQTGSKSIKGDGIFKDLADMGSILTTIGAGVLVAATLYMGIKYMTASPEAQAKLKQQLIGLVVSGFVIFGSYAIWKIVVTIVEKF
jgi:hypothetical protein